MALFTVDIESVAGGNSTFTGIPGRKMFNTTRVSELFPFGASDSAFEYSIEWDGDVQTSVCIADDPVSSLLGYFSAAWNSGAIPLTSYPQGDTDRTETVYLDPRIILFGAEFTNYTKLILTQTRELWVAESITDILLLAVTPDTSVEWTDGVSTYRLDVRSEELNLDYEVAADDWANVWSKSVED